MFAVKQAVALLGDAADFHLVNVVNLQPVQYDKRNPPVLVFHTCAFPPSLLLLLLLLPPLTPPASTTHPPRRDARLDHQQASAAWGHITADILLRTHPDVAGKKHLQLVCCCLLMRPLMFDTGTTGAHTRLGRLHIR